MSFFCVSGITQKRLFYIYICYVLNQIIYIMKSHHQILIIGGGTAGIMVAAQLKNKNKNLEIAIIEPSEKHYYQPAWTLVGAGTFDYKDTVRNEADYIPKGVIWIKEFAESLQPENNQVT